MKNNYLNARNTQLIATCFAHAFNSNHAAKFAMEEWFLSVSLNTKDSIERFEQHFMATTNTCRPDDYAYGNKLIGYSMNATIIEFYDRYVVSQYQKIKKHIYEDMQTIMEMFVCETPAQLLNDVIMEATPYTYDMNNVVESLFNNYILKTDYREKKDRFFEKFPLNWLTEENYTFILRPISTSL